MYNSIVALNVTVDIRVQAWMMPFKRAFHMCNIHCGNGSTKRTRPRNHTIMRSKILKRACEFSQGIGCFAAQETFHNGFLHLGDLGASL